MGEILKTWLDTHGQQLVDILHGRASTGTEWTGGNPFADTAGPAFGKTQPIQRGRPAFQPAGSQPAQQAPTQSFQPAPEPAETFAGGPAFRGRADQEMAQGGGYEQAFAPDEYGGDEAAFDQAPAQEPAQAEAPTGEKPVSFEDLMDQSDPEERGTVVESAIKAIEKANSGMDIGEIYTQATGNEGGQLSRQQKGELLMEFGLSLLGKTGGGASDAEAFGQAGAETLRSYQATKKSNREAPVRAIDAALNTEVKMAQIEKYRKGPGAKYVAPKLVKANGVWTLVDPVTGKANPVRDPRTGGVLEVGTAAGKAANKQWESAARTAAYESLYCEGLTGDAAMACKRKALDYGSKAQDKSAEKRFDLGADIRKELNDPDNPQKYPRRGKDGSISMVRWKDLSLNERDALLKEHTDRAYRILSGDAESQGSSAGARSPPTPEKTSAFDTPALDLSDAEMAKIPEGKIAVIEQDDGTQIKVRKVNGQLTLVD